MPLSGELPEISPMRKLVYIVVLAGLILVPFLQGEEKTTPAPAPPKIDSLIEQLGDRTHSRRELASKTLEAMGPNILPELRKARPNADPEIRRRLDDLIPTLETVAILTPKRITFKITKKPMKDIGEEITKQTGYKLTFYSGGEQQLYSFQFENATFWEVIDKVCETTGMTIQHGYGDDQVRLNFADSIAPHLHRDGVFRFQATGFQHTRNVNFATVPRTPAPPQRSESLLLNFAICTEPKLPLLGVGAVKLSEAFDEDKNSMIPTGNTNDLNNFNRRYYYGGGNYRSFYTQTSVPLVRATDKAKQLKLVRGTIVVNLLAEQKPEMISDNVFKAKGKTAKFGSTSLQVEEVTGTPGKQCEIRVGITEEGKENDYTWMNSMYQRFEVQDSKGEKYQIYNSGMSSNGNGHAQYTFTVNPPGNVKLGPPQKLIFYSWKTTQQMVPFEFKDLPLP